MTIRRLHHLVGRRTLWATLIIAVTVATASGTVTTSSDAASAATAAPSPYAGRVGVNGHLIWVGADEIAKQYSRARAGGVEWVREEFRWDVAEPTQGQWQFAKGDALFTGASKAGVNVLLLLDYGATWANWTDAQFGNYAATLAKRYGANGTFWQLHPELTPRPVTRMEIWNEPYMPAPYLAPSRYAKLVRATSQAVRAVGKDIKLSANVDTGNYVEGKQDYFVQLLAADPKLHEAIDAWSLHPYGQECGPYATNASCSQLGQAWRFDRVTLFRDLAAQKGVSRPIWLTEFGWSTYAGGGVTETTQATWTRDAVKRALVDWGAFVELVFVYQWDRDSGNGQHERYGLRRADDSSKPAWTELASLVQQASGGTGTPPPPPPAGTPAPTPPPVTPAPPPAATPPGSGTTPSPPATPTTNPKSKPKPKPRGGKEIRSTASLNPPVPARLPQWFWPWARWKLGHGEFSGARSGSAATRPRNAPAKIPAWAWRRLSHSWSA